MGPLGEYLAAWGRSLYTPRSPKTTLKSREKGILYSTTWGGLAEGEKLRAACPMKSSGSITYQKVI